MTEDQWLASTDPTEMLEFLESSGKASNRKIRLFAVACCRRVSCLLTDARSHAALDAAEGSISPSQLSSAWFNARRAVMESAAIQGAQASIRPPVKAWFPSWKATRAAQLVASNSVPVREVSALLVDIAALRVSESELDYAVSQERNEQATLLRCICGNPFRRQNQFDPAWRMPATLALARDMYDSRSFDRLPALAEALEAAGCRDAEILAHCRSGGEHVRGCWVVDLVLGKT